MDFSGIPKCFEQTHFHLFVSRGERTEAAIAAQG
jgi:hypothetical protein